MSIVLFAPYPETNSFPGEYYSKNFHYFYQSTAKQLWGLSVAYIIYALETSNGSKISSFNQPAFFLVTTCLNFKKMFKGYLKKFFSLKMWLPLSRLNYSAYLIHTTFVFYFYVTQDRPLRIQYQNIVSKI
jgi:hypothetical protein